YMRLHRLVAVAALVLAVLIASAPASAHATKPSTCFFSTVFAASRNLTVGPTVVGTEKAEIKQNSCNTSDHIGAGRMDISPWACASASIAVSVSQNGVGVDSGSASSNSSGPANCSTTFLDWEGTDEIFGQVKICVGTHASYQGIIFSPDASVCHQF